MPQSKRIVKKKKTAKPSAKGMTKKTKAKSSTKRKIPCFRAPQNPFEIIDLIAVTKSWLAYHISVNREIILSEHVVKIPIADYLAQYTGNIKFELKIDAFYDRRFDLYFKLDNGKEYVIEFKFAKQKPSDAEAEKQRVFNDLIRLNTISDKMETYFMMVGEKTKFLNNFVNFNKTQKINPKSVAPIAAKPNPVLTQTSSVTSPTTSMSLPLKGTTKKQKPITVNTMNIYEKMFVFAVQQGQSDELVINMSDAKIKPLVKKFKEKYKLDKKFASTHHFKTISSYFSSIKNLKTKLICCSKDDSDGSSAGIGVWKIERA